MSLLAKLVYNSNRVYGGYIMLYLYIVGHYKPTYNDAFRRIPKRGPYQLRTGGHHPAGSVSAKI